MMSDKEEAAALLLANGSVVKGILQLLVSKGIATNEEVRQMILNRSARTNVLMEERMPASLDTSEMELAVAYYMNRLADGFDKKPEE